MFIQNDSTTEYFKIINLYKVNQHTITKKSQLDGYFEKHHIIPKSMGGTNTKDNIVFLTAEDHFRCHKLLVDMTEGTDNGRMWSGLWRMMNKQSKNQDRQFIFSEDEYKIARTNHAKTHSIRMLNNNPFKDKKHTVETRERMSLSKKGKTWEEIYGIAGAAAKKLKTSISCSKPKGPQLIFTCDHCGKQGGVSIMKRWHGDKCKLKP
jgi:hypothetical protein